MVVEELTIELEPHEVDAWLVHESAVWDRFLAEQPGFLGKQVWVSTEEPGTVRLVIWWSSREAWKAVPADGLTAVEERMGEWRRDERCRSYEVRRRVGT